MAKKRYLVVIYDAGTNLAAYVPDVETILATGDNLQEIEAAVKAGFTLRYNLDEQERDAQGNPLPKRQLPEPAAQAIYVEIDDEEQEPGKK